MITVENLMLTVVGLKQYVLTWDLVGTTTSDQLIIERSDSPESEFEEIGSVDDVEASFVDADPRSYRKYIPYYYRIKHPDGTYSQVINLPATPDKYVLQQNWLVGRYLRRDIGMKSYYFHYKKYGSYCDCWDTNLKKSVVKDCDLCAGTGRRVGYASPVEIFVSYPQDVPNEIQVGHTKYQVLAPKAWTGNYPLIFPEDIIIRDFDREVFKVESPVQRTGRKMYPSRQFLSLRAVERKAIEFNLIERIS